MGNQESVPNANSKIRKIKKKNPNNQRVNSKNKSRTEYKQNIHPPDQQRHINQNQHTNQPQRKVIHQRNNIVPIQRTQEYNDFSNYNYEIKQKNSDLNSMLVERSMMQNKKEDCVDKTQFFDRPSNSNYQLSNPKPTFDNIEFNPNTFNDQINQYQKSIHDETEDFESELEKQKVNFYENQKKKKQRLDEAIKEFEETYDPWNILGLEYGDYNIQNIKKAYKKNALKYHPDKAGPKYESVFNIINQSYIYLLNKSEETNETQTKTTRDVVKQEYEDYNDGMTNTHIDKDNFSINKFNEIFEKFSLDDETDHAYDGLLKEEDAKDDQPLFSSKVSSEIFNAHFSKLKSKKSNALVEYDEPQSLDTIGSLGAIELGGSFEGGFGSSQSSNLGYTDIKQAHYEENLLINPDNVKYKNYNSIDEYEHERSQISHTPDQQEKTKYINIENRKKRSEQKRVELLREHDDRLKNNYYKLNKKLIVNK